MEQLIQVCYDISSDKTRKSELDTLVEGAEKLHYDNVLIIANSQNEKIEWKGEHIFMLLVSKY